MRELMVVGDRLRVVALAAFLAAPLVGARALAAQQPAPAAGLTLGDAVRRTLAGSPEIQRAGFDVAAQRGALEMASGAYDPRILASATHQRDRQGVPAGQQPSAPGVDGTISSGVDYSLGAEWRLRTGLTLTPRVVGTRSQQGLYGSGAPQAGAAFPTGNRMQLGLDLSQPLLRGAGLRAGTAAERAGRLQLAASSRRLAQVASQRALAAIGAYWEYAAATEARAVAMANAATAARLVSDAERLVAAEQRPAADLDQVRADAADKQALVVRAEQRVVTGRLALAREMGLDVNAGAQLPLPITALPLDADTAAVSGIDLATLSRIALASRPDIDAVHRDRDAGAALVDAARNAERSALDLTASFGYAGARDGATLSRVIVPMDAVREGATLRLGLAYELPVMNRVRGGALAQERARQDARASLAADAERQALIDLGLAVAEVRASAADLRLSRTALALHERVVEHERTRFRQGVSTLTNVILLQDRLTAAQARVIDAQARYATAIAALRHQAGQLAAPDRAVDDATLMQLPRTDR